MDDKLDEQSEQSVLVRVEGDTTRTRSEFENELDENKVQFARIRDKNFVLYQFQRFVICLQRECF